MTKKRLKKNMQRSMRKRMQGNKKPKKDLVAGSKKIQALISKKV